MLEQSRRQFTQTMISAAAAASNPMATTLGAANKITSAVDAMKLLEQGYLFLDTSGDSDFNRRLLAKSDHLLQFAIEAAKGEQSLTVLIGDDEKLQEAAKAWAQYILQNMQDWTDTFDSVAADLGCANVSQSIDTELNNELRKKAIEAFLETVKSLKPNLTLAQRQAGWKQCMTEKLQGFAAQQQRPKNDLNESLDRGGNSPTQPPATTNNFSVDIPDSNHPLANLPHGPDWFDRLFAEGIKADWEKRMADRGGTNDRTK